MSVERPRVGRWVVVLVVAAAWAGGLPLLHGGGALTPQPLTTALTDVNDLPSSGATHSTVVAPALTPGPGIHALGPLPIGTALQVAVGIQPRDPSGLAAAVALEYAPGSTSYRHFLTPEEVADRYATNATTYAAAVGYFTSFGIDTTPSPDRLSIDLTGSAGAIGRAFGTEFDSYESNGVTFFDHPTPAVLPPVALWSGALGLANESPLHPAVEPIGSSAGPLGAGCSDTASVLYPCQIDAAYGSTAFLANGTNGSGVTIGIVDRYDGSEPQDRLTSDLASFSRENDLPPASVDYLYPVPHSGDLNSTSTAWGLEEALDLQWAHAMAPGARIDMAFSPDASAGLYESVDYLVSHALVNILSLSWGEPDVGAFNPYSGACTSACNATTDGSYVIFTPVLAAAAAEGISVFAASGDCGAADGTATVATNYPASDPTVTGVGGTVLDVTANGTVTSEVAWGGNSSGVASPGCQNQGGSGGGYSPFPRPYWQAALGLASSESYRGTPDVAADAGAPVEIVYDGFDTGVSGTSVATPIWAGFTALADQMRGSSLGLLDPALYSIARSGAYARAFHDVTVGSNGYPAGVGWDPITGLGTPHLEVLLPLLVARPTVLQTFSVELRAVPRSGPAPLNVTFFVNGTGSASPGPLIDVNFGDGNATLAPNGTAWHVYTTPGVYVADAVVFDPPGNLSISGPVPVVVGGPANLSVSLRPTSRAPLVGSSVVFAANASGGAGPYEYYFTFGDGTYLNWTATREVTHEYGSAGGFCATVIARDSATPMAGGQSTRVAIIVGGAATPNCFNETVDPSIAWDPGSGEDAPAEIGPPPVVTGGVPPYSVQYASSDPYVSACECAIFRSAGTYALTVYVNDSLNGSVHATTNITVYPALSAAFSSTPLSGIAPWTVSFTAALSRGHDPTANTTQWTFGDGARGSGATASHTYGAPGDYWVVGHATDGGRGNASVAYLVDVLAPGDPTQPGAVAEITPATGIAAGELVHFTAAAVGGGGSPAFRWSLGDGGSAFGAQANQTYAPVGCRDPSCSINITLFVQFNGTIDRSYPFTFAEPITRANALVLTDRLGPTSGSAPLLVAAQATTTGIPGATVLWSFGNGENASGGTATGAYRLAGNYTITDTASDPFGDRFIRSHIVVVHGPPPSPLQVVLGASPTSGEVPLTVELTATASGGFGAPYDFNWSFGDGSVGTGHATTHLFSSAGRYEVVVTVTDPGNEHQSGNVTIDARPVGAASTAPIVILAIGALLGGIVALAVVARGRPPTPSPTGGR